MEEIIKLFSFRDILFHLLNTAILVAVVTFFVYKPARKFLKAREERIAAQLDGAQAKRNEADEALQSAETARQAATADAQRAQKDGAEQAQLAAAQIIADAKREAEAIVAKAKADAEAEKAAAQQAIQTQALSMAVDIAERMIERELSQKDNDTLVREFLTKVV